MTTAQVGDTMGPPGPPPLPATKMEFAAVSRAPDCLGPIEFAPTFKRATQGRPSGFKTGSTRSIRWACIRAKEDLQALLGADYDKLPGAFKAMLDKPDSTLMQYLNNPSHFSRQNAVTWLQSEVLNQIIGSHKKPIRRLSP